jgi:hypothetical protein
MKNRIPEILKSTPGSTSSRRGPVEERMVEMEDTVIETIQNEIDNTIQNKK